MRLVNPMAGKGASFQIPLVWWSESQSSLRMVRQTGQKITENTTTYFQLEKPAQKFRCKECSCFQNIIGFNSQARKNTHS